MARFEEYRDRYNYIQLDRDENGILVARFHTNGAELEWGPHTHEEFADCLGCIGDDLGNRVVVLTGTGESFIDRFGMNEAMAWLTSRPNDIAWRDMVHTGYRLIRNHLDIEVPVIAAVNGPASIHAEQALLADIVICSDTAYFQDLPHFPSNLAPGDGVHIVFPALMGPNRGRQFLLTGEKVDAWEAHRMGLVGEVVPQERVLERAMEHAANLAQRDQHLLRHTRLILVQELRLKFQHLLPVGLAWEGYAACATPPDYDMAED